MLEGRCGHNFPRYLMLLKNSLLDTAGYGLLLPGNAAGTGTWTSCRVFLGHLLLKNASCIAQSSLLARYKEILSSYGTRHHALPFGNRYARWLNFCKDPGFHPKLNEVNRNFFLVNELWISSLHFSVQNCNPLTFLLWLLAKLLNSFHL